MRADDAAPQSAGSGEFVSASPSLAEEVAGAEGGGGDSVAEASTAVSPPRSERQEVDEGDDDGESAVEGSQSESREEAEAAVTSASEASAQQDVATSQAATDATAAPRQPSAEAAPGADVAAVPEQGAGPGGDSASGPAPARGSAGLQRSYIMFVGGIPATATEQDLEEAFAGYGRIMHCRIATDRATGQSRGFGFVTWAEPGPREEFLSKRNLVSLKVRRVAQQLPLLTCTSG